MKNSLSWIISIIIAGFPFLAYDLTIIANIAYIALAFGLIFIVYNASINTLKWSEILGSKIVWIPLSLLAVLIFVSSLVNNTGFNNAVLGIFYFEIYIIARIFKQDILNVFPIVVVLETVSTICYALYLYHNRNGGILSVVDYNIATGVLVFGTIIAITNKQWILITIASIGLFFTGALESVMVMLIMFGSFLFREGFKKNLLYLIVSVAVIALIGFYPFNYSQYLYSNAIDRLTVVFTNHQSELAEKYVMASPSEFESIPDYVTNGRLNLIENGTKDIKLFGNGYKLIPVPFTGTIHNAPMVIVQQSGPIAALFWVFISVYSFLKSKLKYAFIAVFALCLFDFYMWDKLGVWWWMLIGLSLAVNIKKDYVFSEVKPC